MSIELLPNPNTERYQTPDQIRTGDFVILPNFKWFGNKLVRKFFEPNKLVRKILVSGFSWSDQLGLILEWWNSRNNGKI